VENTDRHSQSVHRAGAARLFALALALGAAGCAQSAVPAKPKPPLDVAVIQKNKPATPDAKTTARLRLEAQYQRGMQLSASDADDGRALLRAVADEARKEGVVFSPEIERTLKEIMDTAPPVQPPPAQPPMQPPGQPQQAAKAPEPPVEGHPLPALAEPGVADKMISVDFNQVDIRVVLKTISDITGANFLVDDNVKGTVTLISPTKIRMGEVYKVLQSILEVKGYAAVPSGHTIKIVPRADAVKRNILIRTGSDPASIALDDSVITQIIPLRYANATEIAALVSPLVGPGALVATYPQTNTIMITDTSSNIHHIARIIQETDVAGAQTETCVIPLRHASAQVLSQQVSQMMEKGAAGAAKQTRTPGTPDASVKIIPDARTNSLVVLAPRKEIDAIRELVARLDVERSIEASNIHVVYLKNAEAKDVVKSLTAAVEKTAKLEGAPEKTESFQITADEGTNALIVTASAQDFKVIEDIIAKLDIPREQVLVELRIIEASEEVLKEIGVDWATLDQAVADSYRGFGYTNFGVRVESASGDLEGLGVGAFKKINGTTQIGAILKALERHSGVNILSTPHILTSNNQQATILVGENIPYVKESRVTETDPATPTLIKTYDYRDVGIMLNITPHISQEKLVRLEIDSRFTKLIEGTARTSTDTPTTAKREAKTVVSIMDGSTVVIGGLMRDDKVSLEKRVPILADIPLLGFLFKWRRDLLQKTNLLLFITPHVLTSDAELLDMTSAKQSEAQLDAAPGAAERTTIGK